MFFVQGLLILATLYQVALVVLILLRTRAYPPGRNLAWYLLSFTGWTASIALMPCFGEEVGVWFTRAAVFSATLMVFTWLWFCAHFPTLSPRFSKIAIVLAAIGSPWLVLSWVPSIIQRIDVRDHWIETTDAGWPVMLFGPWVAVAMVAAMVHLARKGKTSYGIARMQIRYIQLGFIGLIAASTIFNTIIPTVFHTTRYSLYGPLIASLFISSTMTISITRSRLLDIRVVLRDGIAYIVSLGILALLFVAVIPWLEQGLTGRLHLPTGSGTFVAAFLLALAYQPTHRLIEHLIERRLFLTALYDFRLSLRDASHALAAARDQNEIATIIVNTAAIMEPRGVAVYLPAHDDGPTLAADSGAWQELPHRLPPEVDALGELLLTDEVILAEELIRQREPHQSLGELLTGWGVAVVVPMVAGPRLCGMLLLRDKHSGEMYQPDDLGYLRILGKQAAIALDNVRHFDEVKEMYEYNTRLLHIMQDGVIALDPQQRVITFNRAAEQITGVVANNVMNKPIREFVLFDAPLNVPKDQPQETIMQRQSGEEVPVLLSVTPFTRSGETEQCHLLVFRDMSAMQELQQGKMQAERFSSMGAMAASLAHEIMNPLVPIQTFAHLLPSKYDDEEFRKEFSVTVVHEVERINWLVGQMLDMVRKPSTEREEVSFREIVQRLLDIIQPECEKQHIRVHFICAPNLPNILGVMNQLYQATMNVLVNAVQAMPDGGDLTIVLGTIGNNLVCRITDTGPGVVQDELLRIFEPLYTTKAGRHGMGLALTYQFIHFHGGEVRADSSPGAGLTITMMLPTNGQSETPAQAAEQPSEENAK
ncbi:MAG: GAF domain-containing sensor histidine kinase [Armatimonadota bacterium]